MFTRFQTRTNFKFKVTSRKCFVLRRNKELKLITAIAVAINKFHSKCELMSI